MPRCNTCGKKVGFVNRYGSCQRCASDYYGMYSWDTKKINKRFK